MSIHTIKDSILGVPREEDNSTYLIYPPIIPKATLYKSLHVEFVV